MTTLVIGAGLIGSQVARILAERGEKPVLMDHAAQPKAIGQIVDLGKVTLVAGDIMRPLTRAASSTFTVPMMLRLIAA